MFNLIADASIAIFIASAFLGLFAFSLAVGQLFVKKDEAKQLERKARRTRELNAVYRKAEQEELNKINKKRLAEIDVRQKRLLEINARQKLQAMKR